eukprot:scaffold124406_cov32-Tisochrysis_lutea.AAC.5
MFQGVPRVVSGRCGTSSWCSEFTWHSWALISHDEVHLISPIVTHCSIIPHWWIVVAPKHGNSYSLGLIAILVGICRPSSFGGQCGSPSATTTRQAPPTLPHWVLKIARF